VAITLLVVFFGAAVIAAFPLWLLARAVRTGVWNGRGVDVFRSQRPIAFWLQVVVYGLIAAVIVALPLYITWRA
jgi:hypothetical protein